MSIANNRYRQSVLQNSRLKESGLSLPFYVGGEIRDVGGDPVRQEGTSSPPVHYVQREDQLKSLHCNKFTVFPTYVKR